MEPLQARGLDAWLGPLLAQGPTQGHVPATNMLTFRIQHFSVWPTTYSQLTMSTRGVKLEAAAAACHGAAAGAGACAARCATTGMGASAAAAVTAGANDGVASGLCCALAGA